MTEDPGSQRIAAVVVTFNRLDLLRDLVDVLVKVPDLDEVLVVDNASQDGTPQIAADYPAAHVIANRENQGFGRACNQGARAALGEVLVFLNPDVFVTPDWLSILVRRIAEPVSYTHLTLPTNREV